MVHFHMNNRFITGIIFGIGVGFGVPLGGLLFQIALGFLFG